MLALSAHGSDAVRTRTADTQKTASRIPPRHRTRIAGLIETLHDVKPKVARLVAGGYTLMCSLIYY
jgi:hypothetical protein